MTTHLAHLCQTNPKYREKWQNQRVQQPPSQKPHWIMCPHRGKSITTISGRTAGVGCSTSRVDVYWCNYFEQPILKQSPTRCRQKVAEEVEGYTGRTCKECQVPSFGLPIPTGGLTQDTARGIITGANKKHWSCLGALAIAAHEQHLGFAVADHGLLPTQRAELDRIGVWWIEHEKPVLNPSNREHIIVAHPHAWWKPWICKASPFRRTAWIDSDAVIVSDISLLFSTDKMFISDQTLLAGDNDRIYGNLLRLVHGQSPDQSSVYQQCRHLNSGIMAWTKGEAIINEWIVVTSRYLQDREILNTCNVRDQSSLLSVLMRRIEQGQTVDFLPPEWNYPADGLTSKSLKKRQRVSRHPVKFLADARQRNPGAKIVHWLGNPKPWDLHEE